MSKTRVLAEPPLIERERELQELDFFLNFAVKGKGKTIFVSGEVGSGKTRLVTEFLNGAKKQGAIRVLRGCISNAAVPYFPFFEACARFQQFMVYFKVYKALSSKGFREPFKIGFHIMDGGFDKQDLTFLHGGIELKRSLHAFNLDLPSHNLALWRHKDNKVTALGNTAACKPVSFVDILGC